MIVAKLITKGSNPRLFFHLSFLGVLGERIILCTLLTCVFSVLASRDRQKDRGHSRSLSLRVCSFSFTFTAN